jgi:pyruvate formate lyase activating enzyme
METCGSVKWEKMVEVLKYVDLVLYDFKHMDSQKQKLYTNVPNEVNLANLVKIHHQLHLPILARFPIVPEYVDLMENVRATADFIRCELDTSVKVHLLLYHRMGES